MTNAMLDGTTRVLGGNFAFGTNQKVANEPAILIGQGNGRDFLRADQPSGKGLEDADVVLNFTGGRINAVNSTGGAEPFRNLKYDTRFDLDGDGNDDTIFFADSSAGPVAYAIIDNYTHRIASQIAEFHTTNGASPRQQALIGKTGQIDTFKIFVTAQKMADANLIFGLENGDKISFGFNNIEGSFIDSSPQNTAVKFDKSKDVTGDNQADTVIHQNGEVFAVIVGHEIDLTDDHFTQDNINISLEEFV